MSRMFIVANKSRLDVKHRGWLTRANRSEAVVLKMRRKDVVCKVVKTGKHCAHEVIK